LLGNGSGQFLNNQAISMYGGVQLELLATTRFKSNLRKQVSRGFSFDFNYTYSSPSTSVRGVARRILGLGYQNIGGRSRLANAFSPNLARAVSDFDVTHQLTQLDCELPVGKGRALAGNANGLLERFHRCWQTSGVARWTSGFPSASTVANAGRQTGSSLRSLRILRNPEQALYRKTEASTFLLIRHGAAGFTLLFRPGRLAQRLRGNGFAGGT